MDTDHWIALADPTRRTVLARVVRAPASVSALADGMPVSRPAVSQHLKVLLAAGLVDVRRHGRERIYTARLDGLARLRAELDQLWGAALTNLKQVAEDTYTEEPPP